LYRRDRIERLGLRFPEDVAFGEDSVFATSYLGGAKVSIVRDYCCYYERLRADGGNITSLLAGSETHLDAMEGAWQLRANYYPRWRREMLPRDVVLDLTRLVFNECFPERDAQARRRLAERARLLLQAWLTPRTAARLEALDRLKLELIGRGMEPELAQVARATAQGERGKDAVIGGRVYGGYPYFRDPVAGVPDECYDVTAELAVHHYLAGVSLDGSCLRLNGHAYIEHVDTVGLRTAVILHERARGEEHRAPARQVPVAGLTEECRQGRYDYGLAGFNVELDLADIAGTALGPGRWGVLVAVTAQGVSKQAPLGRHRAPSIDVPVPSAGAGPFSTCFAKNGALMVDVHGEPPRAG
jgi:CDP-glycerol glycerophosphotransferase